MQLSRMKILWAIAVIITSFAVVNLCWSQPRSMPNPPESQRDARAKKGRPLEEFIRPYVMPFMPFSGPNSELAEIAQDIVLLRAINRIELTNKEIEKLLPILNEWNKQNDTFKEKTKEILIKQKERLLKGSVSREEIAAASKEMSDLREWYKKVGYDAKAKLITVLGEERGTDFVLILDGRFTGMPRLPIFRERQREFGPPWFAQRKGHESPHPRHPRLQSGSEQPPKGIKEEANHQPTSETLPSPRLWRRGRRQRLRPGRQGQARRLMPHFGSPEVVLPHLIKLLEEKLKLMSPKQKNTQHETVKGGEK